ncbi:hypothetical protein M2321_001717 [Rhodoblastus acidophilus]|jgi:hypothetical protein|nr:hypothetical protein [Rhodoblastus acidophilus]
MNRESFLEKQKRRFHKISVQSEASPDGPADTDLELIFEWY